MNDYGSAQSTPSLRSGQALSAAEGLTTSLVGKYAVQLDDAVSLTADNGLLTSPSASSGQAVVNHLSAVSSQQSAVRSHEGSLLFRVQIGDLWHLVTVTWHRGQHRVYLNGALLAKRFDSLLRVEHAMSPEEIAHIVESDAPVFAKTSTFRFATACPELCEGAVEGDEP